MILTATVIKIESASEFVDGVQRAYFKVSEATPGVLFSELRVPNTEGWAVDDTLQISVTRDQKRLVSRGA